MGRTEVRVVQPARERQVVGRLLHSPLLDGASVLNRRAVPVQAAGRLKLGRRLLQPIKVGHGYTY